MDGYDVFILSLIATVVIGMIIIGFIIMTTSSRSYGGYIIFPIGKPIMHAANLIYFYFIGLWCVLPALIILFVCLLFSFLSEQYQLWDKGTFWLQY